MKFKITKSVLLEGLQRVQSVVGMRTTLPILSNVLVSAEKNKLSLSTTDLEVSVRCQVDASIQKAG
jgi:DNA polymerase-3 subunit beta